jgi:hypothetical protein
MGQNFKPLSLFPKPEAVSYFRSLPSALGTEVSYLTLLTYLLNSIVQDIIEKLIFTQLVKKYPAFL